jgi:hypothetical protein
MVNGESNYSWTELTILNHVLRFLLQPVEKRLVFFCQLLLKSLFFLRIFVY